VFNRFWDIVKQHRAFSLPLRSLYDRTGETMWRVALDEISSPLPGVAGRTAWRAAWLIRAAFTVGASIVLFVGETLSTVARYSSSRHECENLSHSKGRRQRLQRVVKNDAIG
jgi:hypothetical protein